MPRPHPSPPAAAIWPALVRCAACGEVMPRREGDRVALPLCRACSWAGPFRAVNEGCQSFPLAALDALTPAPK